MNDLKEIQVTKDSILEHSRKAREPEWLTALRDKAFTSFERMEWPRPDEEEWRRTNLDGLSLDAGKIVDHLYHASSNGKNGSGGKAGELAEWDAARPFLERVASRMEDRFTALNLSLWSGSRIVYVPDGVVLNEPVVIEYDGKAGDVSNFHTVVVLGREAAATVIQRERGGDPGSLWNVGITAGVGEAARLSFVNIQDVHGEARFFGQYRFFLDNYAVLDSFESYTGGELSKSRNEVFLDGSAAEARLNGIYYVEEGRQMDMRTVQYHLQRAGQSRAFFKGAVAGNGRSVYQGLIEVEEAALGTDAYLTNKNLILNDGARADSIPCLRIKTDDVKCSHGSTTGKLDEEALFYLMSRGLSRDSARKELITAFFEELIERAPETERERLSSRISNLIG